MSGALKAFLKRFGRFPKKGEIKKKRLKKKAKANATRGLRHMGRSKGLFGTGLPKVGDMVQGAYACDQLGAFTAMAHLQDSSMTGPQRLTAAYTTMRDRITSVTPIVQTVIGLSIIKVGVKFCRKLGGKWVRAWL